jgi:hypothetical protein
MNPMQVAERYFDAWNRRDATAIVASFASGGTYRLNSDCATLA